MKCASCGAQVQGKFCEYCGSELPQAPSANHTPVAESTAHAGCCPHCGSSRISFQRERISTSTHSHSRKNLVGFGRTGHANSTSAYRTVGLCQNCGYTWDPNVQQKARKKIWLWVLGWLFLFPVPLTIILLRKKDLKPAMKYGLIAAAWLLYLLMGASGSSEPAETAPQPEPTQIIAQATTEETDLEQMLQTD